MIEITTAQVVLGISSLIGALGFLWKMLMKAVKDNEENTRSQLVDTKKQLDKCEEGHEESRKQLLDLNGRVQYLEGSREGYLTGVEKISGEVLQAVKELKGN